MPDALAEFRVIVGTQEEALCAHVSPLIAALEPKFLTVPLGVSFASSVFSVLSCRVTL